MVLNTFYNKNNKLSIKYKKNTNPERFVFFVGKNYLLVPRNKSLTPSIVIVYMTPID